MFRFLYIEITQHKIIIQLTLLLLKVYTHTNILIHNWILTVTQTNNWDHNHFILNYALQWTSLSMHSGKEEVLCITELDK